MALFKILRGDSARISTDITPFHDGYAYLTPDDGGFYIDAEQNGEQKRIRINPSSDSSTQAVTATLTASGWDNSQQVIAITGLAADQNGVIGVAQSITDEQMTAARSAEMYVCAQSSGSLTIAADGEIPACDIPVVVILFS